MSATIWRIATKKLRLSNKKITTKPAVVFDDRLTNQRLNYAQRVNQLPDQELWFLDESWFNLQLPISGAGHQKEEHRPLQSRRTEESTSPHVHFLRGHRLL